MPLRHAAFLFGLAGCFFGLSTPAKAGEVSASPPAAREATPPSSITVPPNFRVELLRSAQEGESSWISMTFDPQRRLIVGLDDAGLARLSGSETGEPWSFERLDDTLKHCRGVLYAHESLYVNATDESALYRLRDRDGDGRFEDRRLLKQFDYRSRYGHGPNQITLGPDGMLYLAVGNDVSFPEGTLPASPYRDPKPDRLLPDPRDAGQDDRVGYVLRTDPEGREWTVIAGGFRNQVDVAFAPDGEMFTWDADMEWDVGLPWYRPTRLNHVVSGGEYGWRWGTMKWPTHYPDSLPTTLDTGLGSPTGLAFGTGSRFPAPYRGSLFMADWQHGRILAVSITPRGATFDAEDRLFAEGAPLNVCDLTFGPDGALYFITGGRGSQSGLYRVSYVGPEVAADPDVSSKVARSAAGNRELRRRLEAFHSVSDPESVDLIWPHLGHSDRWIRHAARVALERQDPTRWEERIAAETDPLRQATACLALVRGATPERRARALAELLRSPLPAEEEALLTALRVCSIALARGTTLTREQREQLTDELASRYPNPSVPVSREACELLVALKWPEVVSKTLPLVESAASQEEQIHYARALLRYDGSWSPEQRTAFLVWLRKAKGYSGGHLFPKVLAQTEEDFLASLGAEERTALAAAIEEAQTPLPQAEAVAARPFVRHWTLQDLEPHLSRATEGRDPEAGRRALAAAQCLKCHRVGSSGSAVGPDLTGVGRRFDLRAIAESIVEPSKVVDPKYHVTTWVLTSGNVVTGRAGMVTGTDITVETNPLGAESVKFSRDEIESSRPSADSPMPNGLVDTLTLDEILDLLAFLRASSTPVGDGAAASNSVP